eukprot:scaffold91482_cov33-Tisochrysis_lutea.AAC.3
MAEKLICLAFWGSLRICDDLGQHDVENGAAVAKPNVLTHLINRGRVPAHNFGYARENASH